jgi:hypothetical protein
MLSQLKVVEKHRMDVEKALDPKFRLEVVAQDWDCSVRHIRDLERRGKLELIRLGRRMLRMAASEKLRYEQQCLVKKRAA